MFTSFSLADFCRVQDEKLSLMDIYHIILKRSTEANKNAPSLSFQHKNMGAAQRVTLMVRFAVSQLP